MVWQPLHGEVVYDDNLGDIWFGSMFPMYISDGIGAEQSIIDVDDCYGPKVVQPGLYSQSKTRFHVLSYNYWGHYDIDYVQDVNDLSAAGVRRDCNGPTYSLTSVATVETVDLFTCIKTVNERFSVAGTSRGNMYVQDHLTMTQTKYGAETDIDKEVIRIFELVISDTSWLYLGFRKDHRVNFLHMNPHTGAVTVFVVRDLNDIAHTQGDLISESLSDVCTDHTSQQFMIKTAGSIFYVRLDSILGIPCFDSVAVDAAWDGSLEMLAMEFVTNDYVLIMGPPGLCTWYRVPKPWSGAGIGGVQTDKGVKLEGNHKWLHMLPYDDGSRVLLVGLYYGDFGLVPYQGDRVIGIYSASVTPDSDVTPTLLFTLDCPPTLDISDWDDDTSQLVSGCIFDSAQVYRGRRRWGTNEFWLVTVGREYMLTVGERLPSTTLSSNALTSTSNLVEWHPPTDEEFENIAWQTVERSHCARDGYEQTKYYCVWAWDKWSGFGEEEGDEEGWPCRHIDNQHPEILPQERDALAPDVFGEVGLVTQAEIHDFDPRLDDFPGGRQFWYNYRKVSYLNIGSNSSVNPATTKPPIQPVEIKDTKDMNLNWNDITVAARDFLLEWDWTPLGSTSADDFLLWQVAMFEDQNPTEWTGAWAGWQHWPQPRSYPGTLPGGIWRYILPWEMYPARDDTVGHPLTCWVDGVNFKSGEKTRLVDRKYIRWVDDAETTEDDKRYSRLLPDTVYTTAVIGWDTGGLWRASGKMTHVPPSPDSFDNAEMIIDRQVLSIRTKAETSFAAICNFVKESDHTIFQRWDDILDPPAYNYLPVNGTIIAANMCFQEFYIEYEVQISAFEFYVDAVLGDPGTFRVGLVDNQTVPNYFPWDWVDNAYMDVIINNLNVGWNRIILPTPVIIRPGIYYFGFYPQVGWVGGDEVQIRTLQWPGDVGHSAWIIDVFNARTAQPDQDLMCRILFNTDHISEGYVTHSGEELTFDFQKSTITDGELPIFEDNCYADAGKWATLMGNAWDWAYTGGRIDIVTTADLYLLANLNDHYGIETRSSLIKTRWRYNEPIQFTCTDNLYETPAPVGNSGTRVVGDLAGDSTMLQQAGEVNFVADTDVCAISIHVDAKTLSGLVPWEVELSLQGDVAGVPDNIKLTSANILASALVIGWNKFTFPATVTLTGGVAYWLVLEPVPCPIGSGAPDFVQADCHTPVTFDSLECMPECIPICAWAPQPSEEIARIVWGPEEIPIEHAPICFLIHEQGRHELIDTEPQGYWVCYDLVTGQIAIDQYRFRFPGNTWWDSEGGAWPFPGEHPVQDEWFDIWLKIVDDCISVFVDKDGYTAEENYELGNSVAHQQIFRDGTDYYDFSRYGYLMLKIPNGISVSMDHYRAYGQHELTGLAGGQGAKMDWGDDSDSGYIPAMDIDKIYTIEPDDDTEPYDAEVHGKNRWDNIDLGFVPAWIDYPNPIAEDDYDRQIYEMWVDNAPPTAVINGPSNGYSGTAVTFDAVGSLDPEGGGLTYYWDFGDGATDTTTTPFVQHAFAITGTYQVSLRVMDELGQYSEYVFHTMVIGELFADFWLIDPNHPLQKEDVTRQTGHSSTNIPDMCGGEQQDAGPGNRVFNIQGLHTPPRCCCDDATDWRLILDLESICQTHYQYEEGIGEGVGPAPEYCNDIIYESAWNPFGTSMVGDWTGMDAIYQQAQEFVLNEETEICAVEFYNMARNLSGAPWNVRVTIQGDMGGIPDNMPLATAIRTAASLPGTGTWERWTFDVPVTLPPGLTFWFVLEPDPCPIFSGLPDNVEFLIAGPPAFVQLQCSPECIPLCVWGPMESELIHKIYQTTEGSEPVPISVDNVVSSFQTGCCDVEAIPYTGGIGQSFTTTDLNHISDATSIQIKIPMCRTADFDGDIEVKIYCDLLSGQALSTPYPVSITNSDIPVCTNGPTEYVTATIDICPFQIEDTQLYVTLTPMGATAGSFSVITTTPYSDKYHYGEKYLLVDGTWAEQTYEDVCMKISTMSDCEMLGCCESKYIDWLWCTRKLIRMDLPCYGLIGAKIVNYKAGKTTNEPYAWIPFTLTIEEIQLEQLGC